MNRSVSIIGDSLLMGVSMDENGKYFLSKQSVITLPDSSEIPVKNLCHMGYTTERTLKQGIHEKLQETEDQHIVLIEFGGNDCDYDWQQVSDHPDEFIPCKVPLEKFVENYKKLVEFVKSKKAIPVAVSLLPIDAPRYFRYFCKNNISPANVMKWLKEVNVIYRWQEMYSSVVARIAQDEKIPFIDLRSPFLATHDIKRLLAKDGIHPSVEGQHIICRTIMEQLNVNFGW